LAFRRSAPHARHWASPPFSLSSSRA
jgi:hypothetical protein